MKSKNQLTLIKELFGQDRGKMCRVGLYLCTCGKTKKIEMRNVELDKVKSCGCKMRGCGIKSHNLSKTTEYLSWTGVKQRCTNKKNPTYARYGGRGITMCEAWLNSFEIFYEDMGKKPSEKHSLDRIDNNKGYSKDNCRWTTVKTQNRNKRSNVMLDAFGINMCMTDWAEVMEISVKVIAGRRQRGWSKYDAVFRKTRPQKKLLKLMDDLFFPNK